MSQAYPVNPTIHYSHYIKAVQISIKIFSSHPQSSHQPRLCINLDSTQSHFSSSTTAINHRIGSPPILNHSSTHCLICQFNLVRTSSRSPRT
ncbi:hypothetical protein PGT21_022028 [Puccinia graminis f. sp. tritici]|uniref:Uncharacterized protein n=1 Tax=Puccinia graminis f. sp. tritici TaxID=56615 RepID=A0A5B0PUU7_PUCGR|nr:hypothetical protein PGT21_022028 [Puccinia graminis f. sp. tritici]